MTPVAFEYCRADTEEEALALLLEFGADASVMAGGLSLGALLNMRLARPKAVIDINRIAALASIAVDGSATTTGALVRQADAQHSAAIAEAVPLLARMLPHVGHLQTRSYGTLGGSAAHADPSAEIPLALVTLDGAVELRSRDGRRRVPARAFFQGMLSTSRAPTELVTALLWPRLAPGTGVAFDEFARRHGDFAICAVAATARLDGNGRVAALSLGLGGVVDRPVLADTAAFVGEAVRPGLAESIAAAAAAELAEPIADLQASPAFRRQLVRSLGARVVAEALTRAGLA